ncbi:thioredoxin domain-containing protein [Actinoallomurus iriomotensis]|uniref:Thioredoxin domain-containing protein n=1 Tax=Actinoallomurus iriomotensis TaxID=478107 RepID=A0A9W6RCG5_9ACTN|nr:thioredoxin domain-containing protein [Actinoallomurus iriomotensis]GLY73324.1 thioredoxin domain-containing protein [Actinoallomurus iriomotensis]
MNRLKDATSPYLLQHADNPVHWFPWGDDAFEEARRRDVPILLSVGYSACHWCHVMAHESFEDPATARMMNDLFVSVKVDREERPDVDAVYMEATQAMTGQGGWPMTVFMTPSGEPFYCGTYFPRAHFQQLLQAVSQTWRDRRDEVLAQGQKVVGALTGATGLGGGAAPSEEVPAAAVRGLAEGYDRVRGGFGTSPKFPPSMVLEFLLRRAARGGEGLETALEMADATLTAMARGGIYDQLGGGFARYSVDAAWVVPHFEKMLYDNALLARVYAHWWRLTGAEEGRRIALETCDWMLADLRTAQGGLASALDADSETPEGRHEEGAYYVWTPEQLTEVLGADDGAYAVELFEVTGTFEHGTSVLQLPRPPEDRERYARVRAALLAARARRVPPGRDDKVVAAWNGLAIAALAECGAYFDRPDLVEAAIEAARLLRDVHWRDGRLRRTSREGRAGDNVGVLEDYADLAEGLIALYGVTGDAAHAAFAGELLDVVLDRFADGQGGFFDTADDAERLWKRPQDPTDNATPSGQFAAAGALLSYAALTGSARHRDAAAAALAPVVPLAERHARFAGWGLAVVEALLAGPLEVAIAGPADDPRTRELHRTALLSPVPAVVATGDGVPLMEGRTPVDGRPAAYVCREFTCRMPVTETAALQKELTTG